MAAKTHSTGGSRGWRTLHAGTSVALLLFVAMTSFAPATLAQVPAQAQASEQESVSTAKPDAKRAKTAYEQGTRAERQKNWDTAYTAYTDAANWAPANREYAIRREIAKSRLVQSKMDAAESDAVSGRLDAARKELLSASYVDPSNAVVRERLSELALAEPGQPRKPIDVELAPEPRLAYQSDHHHFDYRGDTQGAYDELARQFGLEVAFDVDLHSRQIRFRAEDVDFPTAAKLLGNMTGTFWRALTPRLFFVTENTPQKRKDYESSVVRTVLLPASETPEQMTEITRLVREIAGITRSELDARTRTLTLRASPHAVALATDLIDDLERPTGELVLEIEILEVDRNNAMQLGITPPQSARAFTVSTQQIQEAAASEEGLINVIEQVLGTSTPNVIAFGGGLTTYFAQLPGAAANFAEMLSLVRHGRRILLRAQDGHQATFFVGDRIPVSLSSFAPSLLNGSLTPSSPIANPLANYPAGNSPSFIATSVLRGGNFTNDLIVANAADNTVSVLLGIGDGTFQTQAAYQLGAGVGPVWITPGTFNTNFDTLIDLAVANNTSKTVTMLLGQVDTTGAGAATGTFKLSTELAIGHPPVSLAAANFLDVSNPGLLDLAVATQGGNPADNTVLIFPGNGNAKFGTPITIPIPAGFAPTALTTGRFTSSGHTDLVVTEESTTAGNAGQVQVFRNTDGKGTFVEALNSPYPTGNIPAFVVTGDFNADGITDLAVANSGAPSTGSDGKPVSGNSVSIYFGNANASQLNTGDGTFTFQATYAAGTGPTSLAVADYNQDGFPDLAVADATDNAVTLLFNTGTGVFASLIPEIPVGTKPVSIVTADFNQDSRPDAATADNGAAEATVILNSINLFGSGVNATGTPFPGAEYLDIGLKVKATPRIHSDDEVTLQLAFDISSLTAQSFNSIPVISNQSVEQTVRLKQNETAVLAGFRQVQLSNAIIGTPGISDIPGLGLLDQNQNPQRQDSELLIMVTPRMVRLAPRQDHVVYAGQGSLEGPGGEPAPVFNPPPAIQIPQPGPAPPPPLTTQPRPQQ